MTGAMTSSRPYLVRAIYEWILDNGMTPHILVDAADEDVQVPRQFVENGRIVMNISPNAVRGLELGNTDLSFNARFAGAPMNVNVPMHRVLAIYARENGQGMMFSETEGGAPEPSPPSDDKKPAGRSHLKVVK
jgi:stringent starvation protein B